MSIFLFKEIDNVKTDILALSAIVEERLHKAVEAVINRDSNLAREVIEKDSEIDAMEVDLEEELLKVLALHQPVAVDLRFLVAALKINNDLERIGDLAVNIAKRAQILTRKVHETMPVDLAEMSHAVEKLLRESIDALVKLDAEAAARVCKDDDVVDKMQKDIDKVIKQRMTVEMDQDAIDVLIALLRVARDLERVGDHATNIAEDLIYMTDGNIIRHHVGSYTPQSH